MYFFCKQKTAYELRISDWSSDVCSSDLVVDDGRQGVTTDVEPGRAEHPHDLRDLHRRQLGTVGADAQPPTRAGALEGGDELVVARSQLDRSVDPVVGAQRVVVEVELAAEHEERVPDVVGAPGVDDALDPVLGHLHAGRDAPAAAAERRGRVRWHVAQWRPVDVLRPGVDRAGPGRAAEELDGAVVEGDRKSTRLNSSH